MNPKSIRADRVIGVMAVAVVLIFALAVVLQVAPWTATNEPPAVGSNPAGAVHVTMELADGPVELELWPEVAPKHVAQITELVRRGFYDGIVFHRVIEGFMAQTGDPTGTGMGGSDLPDLPAEFSDRPFERGVLGMARTQDPDSANSQFFIMLAAAPHLNGQYTAFGRVASGMEHVDAIKKGDPAQNGMVEDPDRIVSMTLSGAGNH